MVQILLVVLYIVLNHIAAVQENPSLQALALGLLASAIVWRGLLNLNKVVWLVFIGISLVLAGFAFVGISKYIAFLPPIVLPIMVGTVFIASLTKNNIPLVTDIGEKARGPLSQEMRDYTRGVTMLWAWVLVLMALWSTVLPFTQSMLLWSVVTNFANYVLVAVLFVGEFIYRQYRFPNHNHPNLRDYIKIVTDSMRSPRNG